MSSSIPLQLADFYILPLSLPVLPALSTPATHYVYVNKHQPKIPSPTADRSLFLINIPFDATDARIRHLLSTQLSLPNGRIEHVQFSGGPDQERGSQATDHKGNTPKGKKRKRPAGDGKLEDMKDARLPDLWDCQLRDFGSTAIVLFVDRASMEIVIKAIKTLRHNGKELLWDKDLHPTLPPLGYSRYLNHHRLRYPDEAQVLESVNKFMTAFAAQESSQARLRAKQRQEPDEEGFVTVTRGGRNGPAKQEAAQEQAEKQKQRQKEPENFYRFQIREKRKSLASELVKKFEEDKEKVLKIQKTKKSILP